MIEEDPPSRLAAPIGLRKAVSIIMVVLGALLLLSSIIIFTNASLIDTSNSNGSSVAYALILIAVVALLEGAFYLIFGIIGLTKVNQGIYHKKLLSIFLLIFSSICLISAIVGLFGSPSASAIVLYVIEALLFVASVIFTSLSISESRKSGNNERLFALIGVAALFLGNSISSISNIISTASAGGSIAFGILGYIGSIALFTVYFFYFFKLKYLTYTSVSISPEFHVEPPSPYGPQNNLSQAKEEKNDSLDAKAETLKKYKELLDSGAITQEEYNKKKDEILK